MGVRSRGKSQNQSNLRTRTSAFGHMPPFTSRCIRRGRNPSSTVRYRCSIGRSEFGLKNCANSLYICGVNRVFCANEINHLAPKKPAANPAAPASFKPSLRFCRPPRPRFPLGTAGRRRARELGAMLSAASGGVAMLVEERPSEASFRRSCLGPQKPAAGPAASSR